MHAGSLEALLDNLEQLERGLWPPKRPRSSFIYFSAAAKAGIQEQILEEEQQIRKQEEEQHHKDHQVESGNISASTSAAGQHTTKSMGAAPAAHGGSNRRKKSRFSELLSLSWRNLSADERQVYEKLAAADHARFERERDIWTRAHQDASRERQQRMWEEAQVAQALQARAGPARVAAIRANGVVALPDPQECLIKRESDG